VIEHLLSRHEAMNSNPSTERKRERQRERQRERERERENTCKDS
jgi:hypothetical protein